MRFCALILFYDCDQFILRTIANCAPHVEKIFVSYSPFPWMYNSQAREKFKNPSNPELLKQSAHWEKIELVCGDWKTEEDQRNEVLEKAKREGFDYLIIQDADEFFRYEDYASNLQEIIANPGYPFYRTPWYQFWKSLDQIVLCRYSFLYRHGRPEVKLRHTPISYSMAFAIDLKAEIKFKHCRMPTNADDYFVLSGICFHLSYVMSDEQVERKIRTYGHSNQIDHDRWLKYKWYGWYPKTRNLHPIDPSVWTRTIPFQGELPSELSGFPSMNNLSRTLSRFDKICELIADQKAALKTRMRFLFGEAKYHSRRFLKLMSRGSF